MNTPNTRLLGASSLGRLALVLAALAATSPGNAQDVYRDNIVVVLDASGSMGKKLPGADVNKLETAKSALLEIMRTVPPTTNVGVLVFSASNMKSDWAYPLGRLDMERLERAILQPQPGRKTPLGAYLKIGSDALLTQRTAQHGYGTYRLLVLTDGEANDPDLVDRYVPDIVARGITVDVIGVDMKDDHTLATRVHSYRRANDASSLRRAVSEVFAEISTRSDGDAGDDAFLEIAGIPDAMAAAMIDALRSSGNHPIGESLTVPVPEEAAEPRSNERQRPPRGIEHGSRPLDALRVVFIVLAVFALAMSAVVTRVFVRAARQSQRSRRRDRRRRRDRD